METSEPSNFESETLEISNSIGVLFLSILETQMQIVQNVQKFVDDVIPQCTENESRECETSDLFQFVVGMVLFLWQQKKYNLESILDGLHKQSLTSVHSYLCSELELLNQRSDLAPAKSVVERTESDTTTLDPYKEVMRQLQELSNMKPRKCHFCHKESIFTIISAQTRSADEGMTTFVTCSLCGKRQRS